jgi:ribosomal protein S18 acetylase RimI-like enzyme
MAVFESFQKKGIGKMLLNGMIKLLIDHGYKNVSLSVDKNNYAYNLYKSYGFEDYESNNDSVTMIKRLK